MTNVVSLAGDPVFDAIRHYRAASNALDTYTGDDDTPEREQIEQTFFDSQSAFMDCIPTTVEGLRVKIVAFMDSPASDGITHAGLRPFLDTLYHAARLMAVQS
jgi:hypothetical protein